MCNHTSPRSALPSPPCTFSNQITITGRLCMSMNGRQTQILVSVQSAHTNAVLIGSSQSGTRVAVQSAWPLVSLLATALQPSQLSGCCIRLTCNAGRQESIKPHFAGLRSLRGRENKGGAEARTNVEESVVSSQGKKTSQKKTLHTLHSSHTHHFVVDRETSSVPNNLQWD